MNETCDLHQAADGVLSGTCDTAVGKYRITGKVSGTTLTLYISITGPGGRPVIDKTGLSGNYDFVLRGLPTEEQSSDVFALPWDLDDLGLTLKPMNAPVETLVIDHITEPIPN